MPRLDLSTLTTSGKALVEVLGDAIEISDLYSGGADIYDALVHLDPSELSELLEQTRHLNGAVLDLGCGSGRLALPFAIRNREVFALDNSAAMLELLHRRIALLPSRIRLLIESVLADMTNIPLEGMKFDVVLLGTSNVTLLNPAIRGAIFVSVRERLSPQGLFFVTLLNVQPSNGRTEQIRIVPTVDLNGDSWIVTMMEEHEYGASDRLVVMLAQCVSDRQRRIRLLHSRPLIVDEKDVMNEIVGAGFQLIKRQVVDRPAPDREVVLLTFQAIT